MSESLPSKLIAVVDVPEVTEFVATFHYNFFVPDERVNNQGSAPRSILERRSDQFNTGFVSGVEFDRTVPRYNRLEWQTVAVGNHFSDGVNSSNGSSNTTHLAQGISIQQNLNKIHYEDDFTLDDYTILHLQDTSADDTTRFYVKKAHDVLVQQQARLSGSNTSATPQESPQEQAAALNAQTDALVSSDTLSNALNDVTNDLNLRFFDPRSTEETITDSIRSVRNTVHVNNKVIGDLLSFSANENNLTPLSDEIAAQVDTANTVQRAAQRDRDSNVITMDEYESHINNPLRVFTVDVAGYEPVMQVIGYVVEKYEVADDGTVTQLAPIVVESPTINTTIDVQVRYGATYYYRMRSVAYMEVMGHDDASKTIAVVGFLVASKPIRSLDVVCREYVPPSPVRDFQITWDYAARSPRLMWSFPVDTQRDVKYFQVYRRASIHDPFQLIRVFDFDDSVVRGGLDEFAEFNIDPSLIDTLGSSPKSSYTDAEFSKTSTFIYAVCCIDAHGQSSAYSMQYRITFDRQTNKLIKKIVSVAGAPKAYPNVYLNVDTFVDTIKDEGHHHLTIAFNPEYLRVHDNQMHDLGLLAVGQQDSYRLQFINLDLQVQRAITITLRDRTTTNLLDRSLRRTSDPALTENQDSRLRPTMEQTNGSGVATQPPSTSEFQRRQ